MSEFLEEAKGVLNDFEQSLEKNKTLWNSFRDLNPDFEQLSDRHWIEQRNSSWLRGAAGLSELNQLEQWLYDQPPLSKTAKSSAAHCVKAWREWLSIKDAYYGDFADFEFETPKQKEPLIQFIIRMAGLVEKEGQGARLEWRAFKSFLGYLRNLHLEEIAFIEQIFPLKMDVKHGRIIRLITPEVPSIPEETAAQIIMEFARRCRISRPDAQLSAAEGLGLCWLCLTASRLRLPIYLESLYAIKPAAIQLDGKYPILQVPTFFGDRPVRISNRLSKFLGALALVPSKKPRETILQKPFRSLTRVFDAVLEEVSPNPEFGNITFVSLLSAPHLFGSHRYQPK